MSSGWSDILISNTSLPQGLSLSPKKNIYSDFLEVVLCVDVMIVNPGPDSGPLISLEGLMSVL